MGKPYLAGNSSFEIQAQLRKLYKQIRNIVSSSSPVTDLAELSTIPDTIIKDGSEKYVNTVADNFVLDKNSTETVDGKSIVATNSGTGRWVRKLTPDSKWSRQAVWYINADNGNDENDGSNGNQLATFAEFRRRVEPNGVKVAMTVNIETNLLATDPVGVKSYGETVTIVGTTRTNQYSGTVSLFTARTGTTGILVRDDNWTVADHIGDFIRFTDGAAADHGAWILADEGANDARVSNIATDSLSWPSSAVPAPGDNFEVQTYSVVTFETLLSYNGTLQFVNLTNSNSNAWVFASSVLDTHIAGCNNLYMVPLDAALFTYNCCGNITAYGGRFTIYTGAYGLISLFENSSGITQNSYVTIDISLAPWVSEAVFCENVSYLGFFEDVDMFGDFGNYGVYLGKHSKIVFENSVNWGGDITGTTYQGRMYDGSSIYTEIFTHTVTGWTQGVLMYPDQIIVPINDGPIIIPGSNTKVGTGDNFGTSGPMRAGIAGPISVGTNFALPDFSESATDDMPQLVVGNSIARNLNGYLAVAPGGTDTVVVDVLVNGVQQLTMTFTGAEQTAGDPTNYAIVNPDDRISFEVTKTGALASGLSIGLEVG